MFPDYNIKTMATKRKTTGKGRGNPNPVRKFPKGVSGNPAGRPPGTKSLSTVLKSLMESCEIKLEMTQKMPDEKLPRVRTLEISVSQNMNYAVSVALLSQALKGDVQAINTIFDRLEGKPIQTNLVGSGDDFKGLSLDEKREKLVELFGTINRVA